MTRRGLTLVDVGVLAAPLAVGAIGGVITAPRIQTWYRTLRRPPWTPPDAVFGPVWSTLYLLMGIAAILVRHADADPGDRQLATALNRLQLGLNLAWSVAFFGARNPGAGLLAITALWVAIAATVAAYARTQRTAALLLLPYLGWVSFAAALNAAIWRRNRG
jgi:tryptophan-rich sensory protein